MHAILSRLIALLRDPDRNHLWKWIGINPDRIRIRRMRIQCGRAQTGFNPVQCALSAQCGQAFSVPSLYFLPVFTIIGLIDI